MMLMYCPLFGTLALLLESKVSVLLFFIIIELYLAHHNTYVLYILHIKCCSRTFFASMSVAPILTEKRVLNNQIRLFIRTFFSTISFLVEKDSAAHKTGAWKKQGKSELHLYFLQYSQKILPIGKTPFLSKTTFCKIQKHTIFWLLSTETI